LQALAAGHVHLSRDKVTFLDACHLVAIGHDFAAKFVTGNQGRVDTALGPAVPLVNMQIGAADRGDFDFDENV